MHARELPGKMVAAGSRGTDKTKKKMQAICGMQTYAKVGGTGNSNQVTLQGQWDLVGVGNKKMRLGSSKKTAARGEDHKNQGWVKKMI